MEPSRRARLLIADDHTLLAEACKTLLEPEFEVVGIVDNGRAVASFAMFDLIGEGWHQVFGLNKWGHNTTAKFSN